MPACKLLEYHRHWSNVLLQLGIEDLEAQKY